MDKNYIAKTTKSCTRCMWCEHAFLVDIRGILRCDIDQSLVSTRGTCDFATPMYPKHLIPEVTK